MLRQAERGKDMLMTMWVKESKEVRRKGQRQR